MTASLIPLHEVDEEFVRQWSNLAQHCIEPNVFFDPTMTIAASSLPGTPIVELLIVRNQGYLSLLVPIVRERSYRRIPAKTLRVWKHDYSSLGNPLLSPDTPVDALEAALRFLMEEKVATMFVLESFGVEGSVADALRAALTRLGMRSSSLLTHSREAVLNRRGPDETQHGLSDSTVKNYRKSRRRLERRLGGEVKMVDVANSPDLDKAVEAFLKAEASGWKGTDGGAFACRPGHADFFRSLCRNFASEGKLQFNIFGSTDTPVAFLCNMIAQDRVFCFKMAFDEEYRQFSPGSVAEFEELIEFHDQTKLSSMDSCRESKYPRRHHLFPDSLTITTLLIPLGAHGRVATRGVPIANAVGRRLRSWKEELHKRTLWKKRR
ncbi:hypothetical protein A2T55_16320 [Brevibacterium linens]|uniref:BioF2-like acetyltransferase domain-containing protein n=1 Tax=Brevibacterium linens TaxID=1703 RepID=A0A144MIF2_BRELN|nr:GNAT family N-acetyltransferase [Brevibacterium linens]AMT95080.1 hypothetical protein A2T55_16320 [Brevibacterium linens]